MAKFKVKRDNGSAIICDIVKNELSDRQLGMIREAYPDMGSVSGYKRVTVPLLQARYKGKKILIGCPGAKHPDNPTETPLDETEFTVLGRIVVEQAFKYLEEGGQVLLYHLLPGNERDKIVRALEALPDGGLLLLAGDHAGELDGRFFPHLGLTGGVVELPVVNDDLF